MPASNVSTVVVHSSPVAASSQGAEDCVRADAFYDDILDTILRKQPLATLDNMYSPWSEIEFFAYIL